MSEREVLKHKNGCDLYEVTIGVDRVVIDHYCNGVHDDILSFDRIDCAWFAPILAEFAAPTPQPITADWLREQGWRFLQDKWWLDINEDNTLRLSEHSGVWRACLTTHVAIIPLRHVTDTADLANLVAALRGGGK